MLVTRAGATYIIPTTSVGIDLKELGKGGGSAVELLKFCPGIEI